MSLTNDQITAKNFQKFYNAILPYLNGAAHAGFTPIGTVISVMGTTAPLNYLACDGTVYNISDYTELAAYFNQQFGSSNFFGGNGTTTFAVPDLRGEFLRGTGTNSHANQGSGASVGVHQDGTEHVAISVLANGTACTGTRASTQSTLSDAYSDSYIQKGSPAAGMQPYWGTSGGQAGYTSHYTSRPTNTSVLYCIASKNIFMDAGSNYSTEEQVVGTWIDGKPIYQKVISGNLPSAAGTTGYPHNISDVDEFTCVKGIVFWGGHESTEMPVIHGNSKAPVVFIPSINYSTVLINVDADRSNTTFAVIIQYTKTTDA